jgi:hypothetical protein
MSILPPCSGLNLGNGGNMSLRNVRMHLSPEDQKMDIYGKFFCKVSIKKIAFE